MTFADKLLVQLADPATRAAVFDQTALEQFTAAAYDISRLTVSGPYNAVFDEIQLGLAVSRPGTAEGQWGLMGGSERTGATFTLAGTSGTAFAVDAFWRGSIVARVTVPTGNITAVKSSWPDPAAIDREIVNALGALPADRGALETERRARLTARMAASASAAGAVIPALLDRLLTSVQARSVNDWFERLPGTAALGQVRVAFSEGAPAPPSPKALPVAAALLVRGAAAGLGQLLADSKMVRDQMEASGLARPDEASLRMLRNLLVIWVLPMATFDDADWPGANPAARRTNAGLWLAREGIGLAAVA